MHSCLYSELRLCLNGVQNKYAGHNFLTRIQNQETVDFGIIR